jgi:hypothetical protein
MYLYEELEEMIYNKFIEMGFAVDRELVESVTNDIINFMIDSGYAEIIDE